MQYPAQMRKLPGFVIALMVALVAAGVWAVSSALLQRKAMAGLSGEAAQLARQHSRLIDSELARFRLLPIVLGEYTDLENALTGRSAAALERMNGKLHSLAAETGAPVIYLIDAEGRVMGASNAGTEESFVGRDYGFRPYFRVAMARGTAEYYAVGDLSGRPGLFLSRRIGPAAAPIGVVVVKYEFGALTRIWGNDPGQTFIVDPNGIILAATDPQAELHVLLPLPAALRENVAASGQFHDAPLDAGPYRLDDRGRMRGPGDALMAEAAEPVAGTDLQLVHLLPTGPALRAAADQAVVGTLAIVSALGLLAGAVGWRLTRAARAAADRRALEAAVASRTAELSTEIAERARADQRFREAREELAQANRLASLGSITAGLVHEINQPVATIRTLAENARHHLTAARLDRVARNLDTTVELTARIGQITQEMRRFARRGRGAVGPVALDDVIEGTMLLTGDRFRKAGVRLDLPPRGQPVVLAERVRLEQVLVNLLQNALDAVAGRPDPHVALIVGGDGEALTLTVADNGPGVDAALGAEVFSPFVTGKAEGLGLGLGIARDIMKDLGGGLELAPSPLGGAAFTARVPKARVPNA
ncbi:sensor histidine kinase [Sinirhodobacter populi]|uniref:histidine kinase n=1 Tax=Paenirhodobacter populi TaxID=2306993 RepID=A0A443JNV6_9RHOB|nr:sensor histidine kinase [Sinirhodobacter populi]